MTHFGPGYKTIVNTLSADCTFSLLITPIGYEGPKTFLEGSIDGVSFFSVRDESSFVFELLVPDTETTIFDFNHAFLAGIPYMRIVSEKVQSADRVFTIVLYPGPK